MTLLETRDLHVHFRGNEILRAPAGPPPRREPGNREDGVREPYPAGGGSGTIRAVDGVTFSVPRGTTVGVVGESGSGKSTLARAILGLIPVSGGEVVFDGEVVGKMGRRPLRRFRRRAQLVFQDPAASMHPRMTIGAMLDEVISVTSGLRGPAIRERRRTLLARVGLSPTQVSDALPHQVSGGQRQRACIARALAVEPEFLVLDEPTSALDVSVQASVVNLLMALQAEFHLTCLFISHDLALVRLLADRVIILHEGRIVEEGATDTVLSAPVHERTRRLLNASLHRGVG